MKEKIKEIDKEKYWNEFILLIKEELEKIIEPAVKNGVYTSYEAMEDIITNMILFTMNLGRKPFNKASKREVRLLTNRNEISEMVLTEKSIEQISKVLRDKLDNETSWYDDTLANATKRHNLKCALWIALDNFIENNDEF